MPRTSEMRESKFLKQTDVGNGVLWTIDGCEKVNVAKEGAEPEYKWALTFKESDKPLVLNSTNIQLAERIFGSDDTDVWTGQQIVLYIDPNVSYGGNVVGGIRVRAPKVKAAAKGAKATAKPAPPPEMDSELDDSDVPF